MPYFSFGIFFLDWRICSRLPGLFAHLSGFFNVTVSVCIRLIHSSDSYDVGDHLFETNKICHPFDFTPSQRSVKHLSRQKARRAINL